MKNYSYEQALQIILTAAKQYKDKLDKRDFMIVYYDDKNELKNKLISFSGENFCHLTGANTKDAKVQTTSTKFYNLCLNGKLSKNNFSVPKGNMNLKLSALPYLDKLFFNHCSVGDYLNSGVLLKADYFIGNSQNVLSVGFRKNEKVKYDYPVTLYNQPIKQLTEPTHKVEIILRKNKGDDFFSEYTYCNKNFDLNTLNNCEFSYMIKDIHYYKDNSIKEKTQENKIANKSDFVKKSNLSLKQVAALAESGIPFKCKKTEENSFIIVFERANIEKINKTLSAVSEQEQPSHQPKIKR